VNYDRSITSILLVYPYSDFLSEDWKLWPREAMVGQINLLGNFRAIVKVARDKGLRIYFAAHHR
jgi:hypothetical protein